MTRTIPIIELRRVLIVSIQVELSDRLVLELKDNLAQEIRRGRSTGLVLEVSGVDIFDSFIAKAVRDIAHMGRLMGVDTVLAGLDGAMAVTLVEMGVEMRHVKTALNLEMALDLLEQQSRRAAADEEMVLFDLGLDAPKGAAEGAHAD